MTIRRIITSILVILLFNIFYAFGDTKVEIISERENNVFLAEETQIFDSTLHIMMLDKSFCNLSQIDSIFGDISSQIRNKKLITVFKDFELLKKTSCGLVRRDSLSIQKNLNTLLELKKPKLFLLYIRILFDYYNVVNFNTQDFNDQLSLISDKANQLLSSSELGEFNYRKASSFFSRKQLDSAEVYSIKAVENVDTLNPFFHKANIIIGMVYFEKGDFYKSASFLEPLINRKYSSFLEVDVLINTQMNLALAYEYMGKINKSIKVYENCISLFDGQEYKDSLALSQILNNLSMSYFKNREFKIGLEFAKSALEIRKSNLIGYHPDLANSYHNVALLQLYLKNTEEAYQNFKLAEFQVNNSLNKDHPFNAYIFERLSTTFSTFGKLDSALYYIQETIRIREKAFGLNNGFVGLGYFNKGNLLNKQKKYLEAIKAYKRTYKIYSQVYDPTSKMEAIYPLLRLGYLYLEIKEISKTKEVLEQIKNRIGFSLKHPPKFNAFKGSERLIMDAMDLKIMFLSLSKEESDIEEIQLLVNNKLAILNHLFYSAQTRNNKALMLSQNIATIETYLGELFENGKYKNCIDLIPYFNFSKSKFLEEMLIINHYKGDVFQDSVKDVTFKIDELLSNSNRDINSDSLMFYTEIYNSLIQRRGVNFEIENQFKLDSGILYVDIFYGDSSVFFNIYGGETTLCFEINELDSLDNQIEYVIEELRKPKPSDSLYQSLNWLYNKCIKPFEDELDNQKVVILAEGKFAYVPFEILVSSIPKGKINPATLPYLMRRVPISYGYSLGLNEKMKNVSQKKKIKKNLLAVAPSFGGSKNSNKMLLALRSVDTSNIRNLLSPLIFNTKEVRSISNIIGGDVLIREEATKANFLERASDYRVLHLSTHGKSNDENGDNSFLAFSMEKDTSNLNWIYMRELYNLDINAEMVVLSACETGIGELKRGEGVISLARGFSYAGAKSLITSLWSVNDKSTQVMMELFYKQIRKGQRKDEALRLAKLEYLSDYSHLGTSPFYWAGFIATGNMSPITFANNYSMYFLFILPILIVITMLFLRKRNKDVDR